MVSDTSSPGALSVGVTTFCREATKDWGAVCGFGAACEALGVAKVQRSLRRIHSGLIIAVKSSSYSCHGVLIVEYHSMK